MSQENQPSFSELSPLAQSKAVSYALRILNLDQAHVLPNAPESIREAYIDRLAIGIQAVGPSVVLEAIQLCKPQ